MCDFEGFSKCRYQLNDIVVYWPQAAHDLVCWKYEIDWQPGPSPKHEEVGQISGYS